MSATNSGGPEKHTLISAGDNEAVQSGEHLEQLQEFYNTGSDVIPDM